MDCSLRSVPGSCRLLNCAWEIVWDGAGLLRPKTCWGSCCGTDWQAVESRIILDCITDLYGHRQYMPKELYMDVLKTCVDCMWSNQIISMEYLAVIWREVSVAMLWRAFWGRNNPEEQGFFTCKQIFAFISDIDIFPAAFDTVCAATCTARAAGLSEESIACV